MAQPYVGEIRMFAGNFAPAGWMFCDGSQLAISENETLFQLIGTTYGGDGQSTFNLPDLRGRVPVHQGTDPATATVFTLAEAAGVESVTLTTQQIPQHNHVLMATTATGTQANPGGNLLANSQGPQPYIQEDPDGNLSPQTLAPAGGSQPHENLQPFLGINFIISLFGIFPSPT
jgi:microcystin-dependent protein